MLEKLSNLTDKFMQVEFFAFYKVREVLESSFGVTGKVLRIAGYTFVQFIIFALEFLLVLKVLVDFFGTEKEANSIETEAEGTVMQKSVALNESTSGGVAYQNCYMVTIQCGELSTTICGDKALYNRVNVGDTIPVRVITQLEGGEIVSSNLTAIN